MKTAWRTWALVATLALAAGGGAGYYRQWKMTPAQNQEPPQEQTTQLRADAFSLRLFHHALETTERGNVLVAPHTLTRALLALQELAAGRTLEELQSLQLGTEEHLRSCEPQSAALLGMDFSLPRGAKAGSVMVLPFSDNVPMALSLFNGMLAQVTGRTDAQLADSRMVTERTRLLAGCAARFQAEWEIPFCSADTRTADFDNVSGGMPHFRQMRSRGLYRCASADDGNWKAVALPMKAQNSSRIPLVLVGILPAESPRDFAANLNPELLTDILSRLAGAEPEDTLVEFPRLELCVEPHDMRDSLRRLGLKALFDTETADFSQLTPERVHLSALVRTLEVSLIESPGQSTPDENLDSAASRISFDRPFIWLLADLQTGTPVEFMGLVEKM